MVEQSTHDGKVVGSNPAKLSVSLAFILILLFYIMKPLFLTSTRPKHKYKTEKFFSGYLRTRKVSKFVSGSSKQFSNFKKMLVMKKFFMWYYNIKSWRLFFKIFKLPFLQKRYTFRYLLSLYHLLERNLLVLLVRTKFSFNLIESLAYVKNKFIYVNGYPMTSLFISTRVGDIIEVIKWQSKYITNYFYLLFLTRKAARFYFQYFVPIKRLYYITKFFFKEFKEKYSNFLRHKLYYNWIFFKLFLINMSQQKNKGLKRNSTSLINIALLENKLKKSSALLRRIQYKLFQKTQLFKKKKIILLYFRKVKNKSLVVRTHNLATTPTNYSFFYVTKSREINRVLLEKQLSYLTQIKQDFLNSQLFWTKHIKSFYKKSLLRHIWVNVQLNMIRKNINPNLLNKRQKKKNRFYSPSFRNNRPFKKR
jgi:hypothetical protein